MVLDHRELLAELGMEIEEFGGDTVLVRSTPVMLAHLAPDRLLRDLAEHLHAQPIPPTRDALVADLLHTVACKAAVKAGDKLTPAEIHALLHRASSRRRLPSLPARPPDSAGVHQGRAGEAVRKGLRALPPRAGGRDAVRQGEEFDWEQE